MTLKQKLESALIYSQSTGLDQDMEESGTSAAKKSIQQVQTKLNIKEVENSGCDDHLEESAQSSVQIELDQRNTQR